MFIIMVIAGSVVGIGSFMPLVLGMTLARRATPTSNLGRVGSLLIGVLLSLVILAVVTGFCVMLARDVVVPFVLAEAFGLTVTAVAFGTIKQLKK